MQFTPPRSPWLGGAQLARTTTPEPSSTGISWGVSRDLTMYAAHFREQHQAALAIPNVVDKTYTGVLYLSVNLTFPGYRRRQTLNRRAAGPPRRRDRRCGCAATSATTAATSLRPPPRRLLLTPTPPTPPPPCPHRLHRRSSRLRMEGGARTPTRPPMSSSQSQTHCRAPAFALCRDERDRLARRSRQCVSIPGRNAIRALLDVYASGHECEEFWYTNVPDADNLTKLTGSCGGGPYRGRGNDRRHACGAALPFPTIYSGASYRSSGGQSRGSIPSIFHRSPLTVALLAVLLNRRPPSHHLHTRAPRWRERLVVPRSWCSGTGHRRVARPARRPNCNG